MDQNSDVYSFSTDEMLLGEQNRELESHCSKVTSVAEWHAIRVKICEDSEVFKEMRDAVNVMLEAEESSREGDQDIIKLKEALDTRLKLIKLPEEDEDSLRSNSNETVTLRRIRAYQRSRQEEISLHECIEQTELEWQKTIFTEREIQLLQKMKDHYASFDPQTKTKILPKALYKPLHEEAKNWKHLFPTREKNETAKDVHTPMDTPNIQMAFRDTEDSTTYAYQSKRPRMMYTEHGAQIDIKPSTSIGEFETPGMWSHGNKWASAKQREAYISDWASRFRPEMPEIPEVIPKTVCASFLSGHKVLLPKGTKLSFLDEANKLKRSDSI